MAIMWFRNRRRNASDDAVQITKLPRVDTIAPGDLIPVRRSGDIDDRALDVGILQNFIAGMMPADSGVSQAQIDQINSELEQMTPALQTLQTGAGAIEAKNTAQDQKIDQNAQAIAAMQNGMTSQASTMSDVQHSISIIQTEQGDQDDAIAAQAQTIAAMSNAIGAQANTITNNGTAISNLSSTVSSQGQSIAALQAWKLTTDQAIANNAQNIQTVGENINTTNQNVAALSSTITSQSQTISGVQGQIGTIQGSVTNQQAQINANATSLSSLTTNFSGLSSTVSGLSTSVSGINTSISGLNTTVSGLSSNVSNLLSRMTAAETNITAILATLAKIAPNQIDVYAASTDASGVATFTFAANKYAKVPDAFPAVLLAAGTDGYIAEVISLSKTAATVKVFKNAGNTLLNLSIITAGLTLKVLDPAPASVSVKLLVLEPK